MNFKIENKSKLLLLEDEYEIKRDFLKTPIIFQYKIFKTSFGTFVNYSSEILGNQEFEIDLHWILKNYTSIFHYFDSIFEKLLDEYKNFLSRSDIDLDEEIIQIYSRLGKFIKNK